MRAFDSFSCDGDFGNYLDLVCLSIDTASLRYINLFALPLHLSPPLYSAFSHVLLLSECVGRINAIT